ncbi:MAG: glutaminyl-peptide cyclotransferase, partial [Aliifodinibius sp.]|nr:glutaminyl-peptide cyclotransferase [Fodinibius sp.]
ILQIHQLPGQYFGEGVTVFKDRIIQLTWQSNLGFVYDKERFILMEEIYYGSEGWGLTHDGKRLIMSDGSSTIYFLDPYGFQQVGKLEVTDGGKPVNSLNELEYV